MIVQLVQERPADLPDFGNPPIDEVVFGIPHAPLPNHPQVLTNFRNQVKDGYPGFQYQPRLQHDVEQLSDDPPPFLQPALQPILQPGDASRTWLVGTDDSHLIQIQDDLFLFNWRKRQAPYPRFERLLERFEHLYRQYDSAVDSAGGPPLQPIQVEFSYVNWIDDLAIHTFLRPGTVTNISDPDASEYPSLQSWTGNYLLQSEGRPYARLLVGCLPAIRIVGDLERGLRFELTFRSPLHPGASLAEISATLVRGRSVALSAFTELTTEVGHLHWNRLR